MRLVALLTLSLFLLCSCTSSVITTTLTLDHTSTKILTEPPVTVTETQLITITTQITNTLLIAPTVEQAASSPNCELTNVGFEHSSGLGGNIYYRFTAKNKSYKPLLFTFIIQVLDADGKVLKEVGTGLIYFNPLQEIPYGDHLTYNGLFSKINVIALQY